MNIGFFFNTVMGVSIGIALIYIAITRKEKYGNKAKGMIILGVVVLIFEAVGIISKFMPLLGGS